MNKYDKEGLGFLTASAFQKFLKDETGKKFTCEEADQLINSV